MVLPEGTIPPRQYEALKAIWEIGLPGATTLQVWQRIAEKRSVVRTTVLNVVDTLYKRGWLDRRKIDGEWHYWPTASRREIEARVAEEFVDSFFDGSASELVVSLLGGVKLPAEEVEQLKQMLEEARQTKRTKRGERQ